MPFTQDPNLYLSIPTRSTAGTLSLARALLGAAPPAVEVVVAKRLNAVHAKASSLQSVWITVNRPEQNPEAAREVDLVLDHLWAIVRARTLHWVDMGEHNGDNDEAERAAKIDALLFPTGLDFLRLPFTEQWAESERRITLIETDKLGPKLDDLVDARIVERLRKAHEDYGRVLGITERKPVNDSIRVIDALRELRVEIVGLARLVLGLTDENDPTSVAAAEAQLEPILRYRKPRGVNEPESDELEAGATEAGLGEGDELELIQAPVPVAPAIAGS